MRRPRDVVRRWNGPGADAAAKPLGATQIARALITGALALSLLLALLLALALPERARAESLRLTTGDWAPYVIIRDNQPHPRRPGLSAEIVNTVFRNLGYDFSYTVLPFARQIEAVGRGEFAALVGTYQEEAPRLAYPAEAIGLTRNCFYTRQDSDWTYRRIEDLYYVRLTVARDYIYGDAALDRMIARRPDNIMVLTGMEESLTGRMTRLLENGRTDIFIQGEAVANYHFRRRGIADRFRRAGCLKNIPTWIGFAPDAPRTPELIRAFDREVQRLRETGALARILARYHVGDWK